MSSNNGGSDGDGGQGGQPTGGQGQPAGGQPRQPQGGQPAAGQPAAGQPAAGGQHQGAYQGQAAYGESVGDIFSKSTTMNQIKSAIVFYALAGLGIGITGFMYFNQYVPDDPSDRVEFSAAAGGVLGAPIVLGPLLAVPVGLRIVDALANSETDSQIYATAGVTTVVGTVLYLLLYRMLIALEFEGPIEFGQFFLTGIVSGVGAAIVAIGVAYWVLNQTRR